MTEEKLKKANELSKIIEILKTNISNADYTQAEQVLMRETHLKVNGLNTDIVVPVSLFRLIGKLIISENIIELKRIEIEFENL